MGHTPQIRWVICWASRGSRPLKISSKPPEHFTGTERFDNLVGFDFNPDCEMAFNPRNRVNVYN